MSLICTPAPIGKHAPPPKKHKFIGLCCKQLILRLGTTDYGIVMMQSSVIIFSITNVIT